MIDTAVRPTRRAQRDATRARLLQAAVAALIERGVAGTTTLEVQQRAGVSRGTLLHHFPTHAALLSATIAELVQRNEASVWREHGRIAPGADPLAAAIRTLATAATSPSYLAELELWAVSRTDPALRDALRNAERDALKDSERVMATLFAGVGDQPGLGPVIALSIEFARGLALSELLRHDTARRDQLVDDWIAVARRIMAG